MAYLGKNNEETFVTLDAISVVNGQAGYNYENDQLTDYKM